MNHYKPLEDIKFTFVPVNIIDGGKLSRHPGQI